MPLGHIPSDSFVNEASAWTDHVLGDKQLFNDDLADVMRLLLASLSFQSLMLNAC